MAGADRLRGFVGQGMNGRRPPAPPKFLGTNVITATGAGSVTAPDNCWALIGLWGAGGGGNNSALGGDGGDAVFALVRVRAGWKITINVGSPGVGGASPTAGGDTTVQLPGRSFLAKGGGSISSSIGPHVSRGGKGATNLIAATAGEDGGGAAGGNIGGGGAGSGGGGGGGLVSELANFGPGGPGALGDTGANGTQPGGGGCSNDLGGSGRNGGAGQVTVIFIAQG